MARSRRRSFTRPKRPKADWVYRGNYRDEAGAIVDDLGSYSPTVFNQAQGVAAASAMILYDSHQRMSTALSTPGLVNVPMLQPSAARAEGKRAKVLRVQGFISLFPTTWAIGSRMAIGWRFGIYEQNPATGNIIVPATYSMWVDINPNQEATSVHANTGKWQHERRFDRTFSDNSAVATQRFDFRVNRTLAPNECYAIYQEAPAMSVTINYYVFFRSLVVDEG